MVPGHKPDSHDVPKLETLLETVLPDVLVIQSGNNFFGIFEDHANVRKEYHSKIIDAHVAPLISFLSTHANTLRLVYWVTPPQCGSVSEEIQDFVYEQIRTSAGSIATVIDSRKMTNFPYRHMGSDKEHFWGKEAVDWAGKAFEQVAADAFSKSVAELPRLHERTSSLALRATRPPSVGAAAPTPPDSIKVKLRLLMKTPAPDPERFAPYQEILVAYKYAVEKVLKGTYEEKELLVMHPAYIRLEAQPLDTWKVGGTYTMDLEKLGASSLWNSIRREDTSDAFDLDPYLQIGDEQRYPGNSAVAESCEAQVEVSPCLSP